MTIDTNDAGDAIHDYFGLTYAQFLVVPRVVMSAMPEDWQSKMVALLEQLDETFDYLPADDASYFVRVGQPVEWPYEDDDGEPFDPILELPGTDLCDYRHPHIEHRRKTSEPA